MLPKTTNATMPLIRQASGIVTEMDGVNSHAAIAAMALDKWAIVGAAHATDLLRSGTTVKLDGVRVRSSASVHRARKKKRNSNAALTRESVGAAL